VKEKDISIYYLKPASKPYYRANQITFLETSYEIFFSELLLPFDLSRFSRKDNSAHCFHISEMYSF